METVGLGFYFEDMPEGRTFQTIGRSIMEADITNFVGATGMAEVLFTNLDYLYNESGFDQRVVPGALTYAIAEALVMTATLQKTGIAFLGMELTVENPAFAGDTVHVECEVIEARRSKSRPDRGLIRTQNTVIKQDGTIALIYTPLRMMKCRDTASG